MREKHINVEVLCHGSLLKGNEDRMIKFILLMLGLIKDGQSWGDITGHMRHDLMVIDWEM